MYGAAPYNPHTLHISFLLFFSVVVTLIVRKVVRIPAGNTWYNMISMFPVVCVATAYPKWTTDIDFTENVTKYIHSVTHTNSLKSKTKIQIIKELNRKNHFSSLGKNESKSTFSHMPKHFLISLILEFLTFFFNGLNVYFLLLRKL